MSTQRRSPTRWSRPERAVRRRRRSQSGLTRLGGGLLAALAMAVAMAAPAGASIPTPGRVLHGAVSGSIGIRLVDAPVSAGADPRARVYIVDHLKPGRVISRRIEVSNTTAATAHLLLYAASASIVDSSFLGAAGHTPNDLSTWTAVTPGEPDVPAGGNLTATVTIAVPADAPPGEQYGVVWAEARAAPDAGGGVTQVSRVGIRLYVSVGPGGAPAAGFTIDTPTAGRSAAGDPTVVASVHNTGGRALDMNGSMELRGGPGGLNAGPFPATLGTTLAIGATEPVTIALDKALPAGPWDARITLRSGLLEQSASARLTFPAAGSSLPVKTRSSRSPWPKTVVALLAGGVAAALALVVSHRRRVAVVTSRPGPGVGRPGAARAQGSGSKR
ncbi:MAG: hypothetical protein QOF96_3673 [Actinomycetota bacterium]|nr:hypothetical protein [Actinomycetota bacterium]